MGAAKAESCCHDGSTLVALGGKAKAKRTNGSGDKPSTTIGGTHGVCSESVWDKVRESDELKVRLIACVHRNGDVKTSMQIQPGARLPPPETLKQLLQATAEDALREAVERGLVKRG